MNKMNETNRFTKQPAATDEIYLSIYNLHHNKTLPNFT